MIDLFTCVPIFIWYLHTEETELIYNITLVFRAMRVTFRFSRIYSIGKNEVTRQIFTIIATVFSLTVVSAGCINAFDSIKRINLIKKEREACAQFGYAICFVGVSTTNFHQMIYFVVVTLSTVGYGDIIPASFLGKFCVIILIVLAIGLIPKQTSELITLISMQSIYARAVYKSNNEIPFLIVCGKLSVSVVSNFCQELFHPDHGSSDKNAVIIQKNTPSNEMEVF